MVSESKLYGLIHYKNIQEENVVDFKSEMPYPFSDDQAGLKKKAGFIKDIVAMANTKREESAYIIFGVRHIAATGKKELIGVLGKHPDDSLLQQCLDSAKIVPRPTFIYQVFILDGVSYGVIEVFLPDDGPYFPTKRFGNILVPGSLYYREGTVNAEAIGDKIDQIKDWFSRRKAMRKPALFTQHSIYHGDIGQQNTINGGSQTFNLYIGKKPKKDQNDDR